MGAKENRRPCDDVICATSFFSVVVSDVELCQYWTAVNVVALGTSSYPTYQEASLHDRQTVLLERFEEALAHQLRIFDNAVDL